jgi:uncharacterized LabA/DUF88 family protein
MTNRVAIRLDGEFVSTSVLASANSDLVPAMKLARREGLRVLLDTMGASYVRSELKIQADRVL